MLLLYKVGVEGRVLPLAGARKAGRVGMRGLCRERPTEDTAGGNTVGLKPAGVFRVDSGLAQSPGTEQGCGKGSGN